MKKIVFVVKWVYKFILFTLLYNFRCVFSHPYKFIEDVVKINGQKEVIKFITWDSMKKFQKYSNYNPNKCSIYLCEMRSDIDESQMSVFTDFNTESPEIFVCLEMLLDEANKANKQYAILFNGISIAMAILHELWHCKQFRYLQKKGGRKLINKVLNNESTYLYGDSPLEKGANKYGFSLGIKTQDLKELA